MYQKFAFVVSLILHICIFIFLYKSVNFIMPSKSDGINIEVIRQVGDDTQTQPIKPKSDVINMVQNNVPIVDNSDIKIKTNQVKTKIESNNTLWQKNKSNISHTKIKPNITKQSLQNLTDDLVSSIHDIKIKSPNVAKTTGGGSNGGGIDKVKMNNYADLVINQVRPHVVIPDGLEVKLITIVRVVLLPNMDVYEVKIIKSSGNLTYDNNVISAIKIVKRFPNIPNGENWIDYRVINLTFKSD
jgi:TonB family protein